MKRLVVIALLMAGITDPGYSGTAAMQYDTSTHAVKKPPTSAGAAFDLDFTGLSLGGISGGGTPGGSNQQVQFNNSSAFGGVSSLTSSGTVVDQIAGSNYVLHDLSDNTKKATFNLSNIGSGSTRTINIPNANSTTIQSDTGATNNFLTAISAQGLISKAQPSFSNLSGAIAASQQNIPVGANLYVDATNGNNGTALRGRFDKPFLTIASAIAAASSGDVIYVGPGTFTETVQAQLPAAVSLIGSGMDVTKLVNNTTTLSSGHACVVPGTGSFISDITINSSGVGSDSVALGCLGSDTAFTSAFISRVKLIGNDDAFYFDNAAAGGLIAYDCTAICNGLGATDTLIVKTSTSGVYEFYNCEFLAVGAGTPVSCVRQLSVGGIVRIFGGRLSAKSSPTNNRPAVNSGAGTLELWNVRLNRDNPGNDLFQSAGTLAVSDVNRDDGAALSNSGTITQLSRYAIRDNNLSDLASASTARTNLGLAIGTNVQAWDTDLDTWAAITRASGFDTFTATPSSANLRALLTDENGTGAALFSGATSPTFVTPVLGTPTSVTLTNATGLPPATGIVGWPANASGSLTNNGSGTLSWVAAGGTGTVTNIGTTSPITGGPITTTGTLGLDVSVDHAFTGAQSVTVTDAITNVVTDVLSVGHNSSGTPATSFGTGIQFKQASDTTANRQTGEISTVWTTATDATRSAGLNIKLISGGALGQVARFSAVGGLSVGDNSTTATGIINARNGYTVNGAAASRKVLVGDGTNFIPSTETYAVPGTSGNVMTSDGTNWTSAAPAGGGGVVKNSSTSDQTGFAADTYLAGSSCVVGAGAFAAKNQYHCTFDMAKTALGTAAMTIDVRIGTAGTTSDTSRMTFTFGAGTAAADGGTFEVWITFRTVGGGTSAVVSGICRGTKGANSSGLFTNANNVPVTNIQGTTSAGFDSSAATTIGISVNGGASFSGTNKVVQAELF